ncbi:protein trunk [Drosophila subobscura]|uniref:protein trunk n=1 Tax=Drosophila subobscura TaxID=7241 RepID=UPI00155AA87C|nr:protein trunk [Drosophila subobscura]
MNLYTNFNWFCIYFTISAVGVSNQEDYCAELSTQSLSRILGQAFNPRYMSIEPPGGSHDENHNLGYKRSSYDIPFYADRDVVSLGNFPAWETDHFAYFGKREETIKGRKIRIRSAAVERGGSPKTDVFKHRPWECSSQINWIDLGLNYFPRYIRSIECISRKCWYGHFNCKPKSFTVKVLRRKSGSCIQINDKLVLITAETFKNDYTQLWIWEEIAVNFCCECVMLYL